MAATKNGSLVTVYTSPVEADAELVRSTLVEKGIRATVVESNGPFAGLLFAPSEVLVWQADEARARSLIEEAEWRHHERIEHESVGCCDTDQQ